MRDTKANPPASHPVPLFTVREAWRWVVTTRWRLADAATVLDRANVFPVADGDTGTNMHLTLVGAWQEMQSVPTAQTPGRLGWEQAPVDRLGAVGDAVLREARGNSGIILAQLLRGGLLELSETLAQSPQDAQLTAGLAGDGMARALTRADELAWQAVANPRAGTILSVSRASAQAARDEAQASGGLAQVVDAALAAAREALVATPAQLAELRHAEVADAGGAGYVIALLALAEVCQAPTRPAGGPGGLDEELLALLQRPESTPHGAPHRADEHDPSDASGAPPGDGADGAPHTTTAPPDSIAAPEGIEVVLGLALPDVTERRGVRVARRLRRKLQDLGDSVVVAGSGRHWRVHVHVVGAQVVEQVHDLCAKSGRVSGLRTENLGQVEHPRAASRRDRVALVVASSGSGLNDVLRAGGAQVVESSPTSRAGTDELVTGALATGASTVALIPGDHDLLLPARQAVARLSEQGVWADVVATTSIQQSVAAVAVHAQESGLEAAVKAMTTAAAETRGAAVRYRPDASAHNAFIGTSGGKEVARGTSALEVVAAVIEALPTRGAELATVIIGGEDASELARAVEAGLSLRRRGLQVQLITGGPAEFPVLIGVE